MMTGRVKALNTDGTITFLCDQTNQPQVANPCSLGGKNANFQYAPSLNDIVLVDDYHNTYLIAIGTQLATEEKGRLGDTRGTRQLLQEGEAVIRCSGGQQVFLDAAGNIRLMPGPNGKIYLGYDTKGKALVRDGDSVSLPSGGTGTVHASSIISYSD